MIRSTTIVENVYSSIIVDSIWLGQSVRII